MLKFVIALIADFERVNIDVSNERHSIDGLKALKHIECLTAEKMNAIRFKSAFEFVGDDIHDLMLTDEWKPLEEG